MSSFITNRTVPITDGATNLTTFPTYNFKKMLQTANGKLYLLADSALYLSHDDGITYKSILTVSGGVILTSVIAGALDLYIGSSVGLLTVAIDNSIPNAVENLVDNSNIKAYSIMGGIRVNAVGVYNVTIYSLTGQILSTNRRLQGEVTLPLSGKQSIYLVKVDTAKQSKVIKVILQ
jgi:hypothetical protein